MFRLTITSFIKIQCIPVRVHHLPPASRITLQSAKSQQTNSQKVIHHKTHSSDSTSITHQNLNTFESVKNVLQCQRNCEVISKKTHLVFKFVWLVLFQKQYQVVIVFCTCWPILLQIFCWPHTDTYLCHKKSTVYLTAINILRRRITT